VADGGEQRRPYRVGLHEGPRHIASLPHTHDSRLTHTR
jgi:hypothetical protein